ncbi:MAG: endo-1,4-beta-xylanase [Gemmataceae bacterium]|nr:endo-1,4-beta-xylanase [Gemmataceae bacterium]
MGSLSFLLPSPPPAGAGPLLRRACLSAGGYDPSPVPTKLDLRPDRLVASRGTTDSGFLALPWPVGLAGVRVAATTTLRERDEPYDLMVELARGKLNQVRNQTADWREVGLLTPPDYDHELAEVTRLFGGAVLGGRSAESEAAAAGVLDRSFRLADRLARLYAGQMFATRVAEGGPLPTDLAARHYTPPEGAAAGEYRRACTAARVGPRWRDVEPAESRYNWATADAAVGAARLAGQPVTFGPVLDLGPGAVPDWVAEWAGDLPTLAAFMCDYLETVVGRYKRDVRRWVVCGGFNHADGLGLRDDDRLRLAARLVEAALQLDPDLDVVVGVAQPWGDYLAGDDQSIPPGVFAEDLVRTGLKVSAVEVEVRAGTRPRAGLPRDLLDTSRLLDAYARLGLPVEVLLSHPAGAGPDPAAADHGEGVWADGWPLGVSPADQAEWGAGVAALALCKPAVRAVTWDHWADADPHLTPHGGLLDPAGRPRPLLAALQTLRANYLR